MRSKPRLHPAVDEAMARKAGKLSSAGAKLQQSGLFARGLNTGYKLYCLEVGWMKFVVCGVTSGLTAACRGSFPRVYHY